MFRRSLALALPALVAASLAAAAPAPSLSQAEQAQAQAALAQAEDQGFAPGEFSGRGRSLPDALADYARAQHGGRLPPASFPKDWAIRPPAYDPAPALAQALASGGLDAWLAGLPPPDPAYRTLTAAYVRYRSLAVGGGWAALKTTLKPGDSGPAVAALRARLAAEDPQTAGQGDLYDEALRMAVARAQARHGLEADGVAGRATLAALNVSAQARADQIAANLERRRWMPRSPPPERLELNIADASLVLIEPGSEPLGMRVVVGKPDKRTPMFRDEIRAIVLNPPWNVPEDIAAKEIWPKIRKDPGYMAREGFVVKANGQLEQTPGPRCALGAIKFDLSNPFGVYLHDTPARSLFAQPNRDLSHGCMRVEQPNALAKRLLSGDPAWTAEAVDLAILKGATVRIPLKTPVPVLVAYWTAFVDGDGTVEFRPDIYGWDHELLARLAAVR